MGMTTMAAALQRAGAEATIGGARLYTEAVDTLRRHGTVEAALPSFLMALRRQDGLLYTLARHYLEQRWTEMNLPAGGQGGVVAHSPSAPGRQTQEAGGGHIPCDAQPAAAAAGLDDTEPNGAAAAVGPVAPINPLPPAAPTPPAGGGHTACDTQNTGAATGRDLTEPNRGGEGHLRDAAHFGSAPPPRPAPAPEEGQARRATHEPVASPAREPTAAQQAAVVRVQQALAKSLFDTHKMRDGRGIGALRFFELEKFERANATEARLCRLIRLHVGHAEPFRPVRELIGVETLQRMIEQAREPSNG